MSGVGCAAAGGKVEVGDWLDVMVLGGLGAI